MFFHNKVVSTDFKNVNIRCLYAANIVSLESVDQRRIK